MTAEEDAEARDVGSVCKSCGRKLSPTNSVGYCQQTVACRRAYRRMGNPKLQAVAGIERRCESCGSRMRADNVSGYCQRPACRRVCRRMKNPKLQATSRIERRCEACGSRIRADNVSGYCNAPDCRRTWGRLRGRLRRPTRREYHRNYNHGYRRANPEPFALKGAKRRAKSSGVPFRLTEADLPPIPDRCPVFNTVFRYGNGRVLPESLTLDRIVPTLGYVPGNVMWLSHRANAMKQNASIEELHKFARWALAFVEEARNHSTEHGVASTVELQQSVGRLPLAPTSEK